MQGDDPPYLTVGTDVSAKYKGAFCEAKIKKVVKNIKCKVTLKDTTGTTLLVSDEVIKGTLRVGSTVEVKTSDQKKELAEATITKLQDCSQYTVVFDDGDITTLRRTALCLKSGRHFNESETLDQLPLTHPEHFSTPVISGRRGRRGGGQSEEGARSSSIGREPHSGRVVLVEGSFPGLVLPPRRHHKITKEDYLVRSFKDGRYYTVPRSDTKEFKKNSNPNDIPGANAALQYLNTGTLPPHWDADLLQPADSDESSDDEPREEKDHFVAQLYKFMDDRGTPLNRNPTIGNKDVDLYRLFKVVQKMGGYNKVTNQNLWKIVAEKMGFHTATTATTNLYKQAYKKFLHSFEDFYRKLGVTLVAHPRGSQSSPAGRALIRDRDRAPTVKKEKDVKDSDKEKDVEVEVSIEKEKVPVEKEKEKEKVKDIKEKDMKEKEVKEKDTKEKVCKEKDVKEKEKEIKKKEPEKEKVKEKKAIVTKPPSETEMRQHSRSEQRTMREERRVRRTQAAVEGRPHASTDSDSSGRASRCAVQKKAEGRRSQSANSASSGNTVSSTGSKRPRKRKNTDTSQPETPKVSGECSKASIGDKLKVYYGPNQSESKVTYEAKVIEINEDGTLLRVHYTGWNTRYDEWIKPQRIAVNITREQPSTSRNSSNRRPRLSRMIKEKSITTGSDSDSDSEEDRKIIVMKKEALMGKKDHKKGSISANDSDSKAASSERESDTPRRRLGSESSRGRPIRTRLVRPSNTSAPTGRDYDLNEIRSELKGLRSGSSPPTPPSIVPSPPKETTAIKIEPSISTPKQEVPPCQSTLLISVAKTPAAKAATPMPKPPSTVVKTSPPGAKSSVSAPKLVIPAVKSPPAVIKSQPSAVKATVNQSPKATTSTVKSPAPAIKAPVSAVKSPNPTVKSPIATTKAIAPPVKLPVTSVKTSTPSVKSPTPLVKSEKSPPSPINSPPPPVKSPPIFSKISTSVVKSPPSTSPQIISPNIAKAVSFPQQVLSVQLTSIASQLIESKCIISLPPPTPIQPPTPIPPPPEDVYEFKEPEPFEVELLNEDKKKRPRLYESSVLKTSWDVPEPPSFIHHSEGPKVADKILEAINNAKRSKSNTPPPEEKDLKDESLQPASKKTSPTVVKKEDPVKVKSESESSEIDIKPKVAPKSETGTKTKNIQKLTETVSKTVIKPEEEPTETLILEKNISIPQEKSFAKVEPAPESQVGEVPSDEKSEIITKSEAKELISTSKIDILSMKLTERRKSGPELTLIAPGKSNKVLSETIQKLSNQIQQPPSVPIPAFVPEDKSESSDSEDSDRSRLVIDKLSEDGGSSSPRPSPPDWSAGESLLMLEDLCTNEVVEPKETTEDDSNISLLLCEESIPGSPAPPPPTQRQHDLPFASTADHKDGSDWKSDEWRDSPMASPPTSMLSPQPSRKRKSSERELLKDESDSQASSRDVQGPREKIFKEEKTSGGRSRKSSECGERATSRRHRSDVPLKYNFYVQLGKPTTALVHKEPSWDSRTRINTLLSTLSDLRAAYLHEKAELAAVDRRRKKLRRKEREGKAAKTACA